MSFTVKLIELPGGMWACLLSCRAPRRDFVQDMTGRHPTRGEALREAEEWIEKQIPQHREYRP